MSFRVVAVVVTFNPKIKVLRELLTALQPQVEKILIVDNGSTQQTRSDVERLLNTNIELIPLSDNLGLGAAHNVGLRAAIDLRATCGLLMDQDSIPDPGMVASLTRELAQVSAQGRRIAALGPRFKDRDDGRVSTFVRIGWFRLHPLQVDPKKSHLPTDFLISSGTLIPLDAWQAVGEMDESLFIDHVDTEWCLRAIRLGYQLIGVPNAIMNHTLGESRRDVWFLRHRTIPFHKPFRYYYIYRNSVLLYKRDDIPIKWKLADATRCLKMMVVFALLHPERGPTLTMMWRGIRDGLRGHSGSMLA